MSATVLIVEDDADLREANLWGVDLTLADMRGANLSYTDLGSANLMGADTRAARFESATFCNTKMPTQEMNQSGC